MDLNTLLQAAFLGIVQGLTEFIPVSSSGHLQIIPDLFGWKSPSTTFILLAHIGTLLALLIYFRQDLWQFALSLWRFARSQGKVKHGDRQNLSVIVKVVLATIPAGLFGLLLEQRIDSFYTDATTFPIPSVITATAMLVLGIVFLFAEKLFTGKKGDLNKLSLPGAILIGIMQVLALLRGVSRSGITILTGLGVGLTREGAARFSFLMSIPIMTATSLFAILDVLKSSEGLGNQDLVTGVVALITSFIFGFIAIKFLLSYLQRNSLAVFGWYRIAFAVIVLIIFLA